MGKLGELQEMQQFNWWIDLWYYYCEIRIQNATHFVKRHLKDNSRRKVSTQSDHFRKNWKK
jgi:hypothetical protein